MARSSSFAKQGWETERMPGRTTWFISEAQTGGEVGGRFFIWKKQMAFAT
jgi:hypothetical protein